MASGTNWSLKSFFPKFNGPEMIKFKTLLVSEISSLAKRASKTPKLSASTIAKWRKIFGDFEILLTKMTHYDSYVTCLASEDARIEAYQREVANLSFLKAEFSKIEVELKRAFQGVPAAVCRKFISLPCFNDCRYYLSRVWKEASKTMSPVEESLAADLSVDGILAWENLYNKVSSKMEFEMVFPDGKKENCPMAQRRSLMEHPDPRVRKVAFENGNKVWKDFEDVIGACLNHISGTRLTLYKHRNIKHFLDVPLFQAGISAKTLNSMFEAVHSTIEIPRRIARAKAKILGMKALSWQDFDAALPEKKSEKISWEAGLKILDKAFRAVFPKLADFLNHCLEKKWVESEPRAGKRPGAYCTGSYLNKESRVFMTYNGTLGDIQTLAHEIGHAYHNHVMRDLPPFSRSYPMTLAESASTFAETIFSDGILADSKISKEQKTQILNLNLSNAIAFLMNIPVRFEFERNFYSERAKGPVPISRIKELMVEAQRKLFGNTLMKGGEDPYFWASKLHFYITEVAFYNFPYTFGFLLSRGLFNMFKQEGPDFLKKYDEFLSLAGSDSAVNVARRTLGCDLEKPSFWLESIKSLEPEVKLFEKIAHT